MNSPDYGFESPGDHPFLSSIVMSPIRAYKLIDGRSYSVSVRARSDKYMGKWVAFVSIDGEEFVGTESESVRELCLWRRTLEDIHKHPENFWL